MSAVACYRIIGVFFSGIPSTDFCFSSTMFSVKKRLSTLNDVFPDSYRRGLCNAALFGADSLVVVLFFFSIPFLGMLACDRGN